ncbi:uncharacterized protein C5orf34 homolog [Lineus longissimus]|uniref:uncharacterized protein C5orf34 homolog n=1 Tax=Lineus longissimus TaxID=88925 RepID=UPI002B4D3461
MADPLQMILFGNNAIEVAFSDTTKLQISACGTTFVHDSPTTKDAHPLHGMSRITQRTQYTTSEFHDKVTKALEFRNLFAERPFLCQERIPEDLIETLYDDIKEVRWPATLENASTCIRKYDKSSVRITSLDGHAHVTLSPHSKDFTVQYRAKLSQPLCREKNQIRLRNRTRRGVDDTSDDGDAKGENQKIPEQKVRWSYTWSIQYHSVASCPECWQHPLDLLLEHRKQKMQDFDGEENKENSGNVLGENQDDVLDKNWEGNVEKADGDEDVHKNEGNGKQTIEENGETENFPDRAPSEMTSDSGIDGEEMESVMSTLPVALPLQCSRHHLHRWRKPDGSKDYDTDAEACCFYGRVRVICSEGVIYRLAYTGSRLLEIYPGDGTIILSKSFNSDFFIHHITKADQIEERTYSIRNPPPNSCNFAYPVQKLIKRGYRIMRCVTEAANARTRPEDPPCWLDQDDIVKPAPTVLESEQVVPGIGKFTAYSNGRIRIVFTDRASLDMTCGLERGRKQVALLGKKFDVKQIMSSLCRMFMPTGHYLQVQIHDPGDCSKYIDYAKDWAEWLITPGDRRAPVFGEDLDGTTRKMSVQQELQKIKCFNYILDNVVLNSPEPDAHGGSVEILTPSRGDQHPELTDQMSPMSMAAIQEILKKTSQTISDIDNFCVGAKKT